MRHIALFLTVILLFGMMPTTIFAASDAVLFNERFDNIATNGKSDNILHSGDKNARVIQTDINNKVFMMSGGMSNTLTSEFMNTNNLTVFSVRIKMTDVNSRFSFSFSDSSKSFTPVTVNADGVLLTHDGKQIGGIPRGVYTSIQIGYNTKSRKYFVIQDGKLKVASWKSGTSVSIPVKFTITSSYASGSEDGTIYVDDIQVYNGDSVRDDLPKVSMNKEILEFEPQLPSEPGSAVIIAADFEDGTVGGLTTVPQGNYIGVEKERDGNKYMLIDKNTSKDAYFQLKDLSQYGKYIIVEADIKCEKSGAQMRLFGMRDDNSKFTYALTLKSDGTITTPDGTVVGKPNENWFNFAVAYDFDRMCFDLYLNKELIYKNVALSNAEFTTLSSMRTHAEGSATSKFAFDNVFIYEGKELRDIEIKKVETTNGFNIDSTVLPTKNKGEEKLLGKYAFHPYADTFYQKDKKIKLNNVLYVSDETAMMPVSMLGEYMNVSAQLDGNNLTVDGKTISLKKALETRNGIQYISIEEAANAIGKKYTEFEGGLIILSDEELEYKDEQSVIFDLDRFMFFDRKSPEELKTIFENNGSSGVHPRVLANADTFARLRREIKTNSYLAQWHKNVMEDAEKYMKNGVPATEIDLDISRAVLDMAMTLGYAYQITGNRKYARAIWKEYEMLSNNFQDWHPAHFLDVGEMTAAFAVGYDWCYDEFSPEERALIEEKIINNGLLEGKKCYEGMIGDVGTDWVRVRTNWNMVCNGGLAVGAMAIADKHPDVAFYTIACGLRGIENSLTNLAPDGGWGEGPGYWGYVMRYMIFFMDSLTYTFGTDFNIPNYKGVSNTDKFVYTLQGNTASNGFHDSWSELSVLEYCFWLAKRFNKPDTTGLRLQTMKDFGVRGAIKDILWYDSSVTSINQLPELDNITRRIESASMRSSWTDLDGLFASYHGGFTKDGHYHIDHGSFVLDLAGIRWAVDIGPDNYVSGYFAASKRPTFYRVRAEGHNTYVINPSEDGGQELEAFCPIVKSVSKEGSAYQVLDMTDAYRYKADSAIRGYMLSNGRRTFTVQDEITLKEESEVYWFMHTMADIEIVDKNTAILTQDGVKLQFKILANTENTELTVMDAVPLPTSPNPENQAKNSGYRKILFKVKGSGDLSITARMTLLSESGAEKELTVTKIADWVPDDSKMISIPEAEMMYVDGVEISEFTPKRSGYAVMLPYDYETLPIPTIKAPGYVVETMPTDTTDKDYEFKIYSADNPDNYRIYNLHYTVLPKLDDVLGYARYTPAKIYASAVPEEENNPTCTVDQDYITRWAASGTQWIEQDFGSVRPVDAVAVAFTSGQKRSYYFSIEVSEDGVNYTQVYDGASGGLSEDMELFKFNGTVNARYVRYCGRGNSSNKYNNLLEFAVLKSK